MDETRDSATRIAARPDLAQRQVGGQWFIVGPEGRMVILDNETAGDLWTAISAAGLEGTSLAALADGLVRSYEVTAETALEDVASFTERLLAEDVVRLVD